MIKKHILFDMDNTITRSRSVISDAMHIGLIKLIAKGVDITIVSGARMEQMHKQLGRIAEECALLAQNGNHATNSIGKELWKNELNWLQKNVVFNAISAVVLAEPREFSNQFDLVEDRGCQISYSLIGHNADRGAKEECDPDQMKRKSIIERYDILRDVSLVDVKYAIGGTTCIDFFVNTKGENVKRFIESQGWKPEECVYVGDALFAGGNDQSVIGVVDTIAVEDSAHCLDTVKKFIDMIPDKPVEEEDEDEEEEENENMRLL